MMLHYTECGLQNVWLKNGFTRRKSPCGEAIAITDRDGLHRAIGEDVVHNRPRLAGDEVRFLRKEMGLSQKALADCLGCDAQTVANWEKDKIEIGQASDVIVRVLYLEYTNSGKQAGIRELIERINEMEREAARKVVFSEEDSGEWTSQAA